MDVMKIENVNLSHYQNIQRSKNKCLTSRCTRVHIIKYIYENYIIYYICVL